jgi:hypothetical protein
MILVDKENLEFMCWKDKNGQWWERTGECRKCGFCCGYGRCEYLKNNVCGLRLKGLWNVQCYLGTLPDHEHFQEIDKVCGYKWVKKDICEYLK